MEQLFYRLLNFSINASWLVLAVLMLRVLLKKAPRWLHVALWGLVGLRLVLPFSIESVFSLIPSAETVPPEIVYEQEPAINSGITAINSVVNPILAESFAPREQLTSINPLQVLGFAASVVWLIGLILMVGYMLFGYLRLRFRLRTATKREENIYESENAASPFILGVFRPRIYLPYGLDEETFSYVIAHERAHLKRRDHLIKPLAFLLLAVYWFQPLLWVAYILLCRDIEYACDEKVIKNESEETRRAYSMALLSCSIHRRSIAACPLAFGEGGVKERVKNVMNYKKPAFWLILLAVVAIIVTAVCFLTDPISDADKTAEVSPPMYYAAEKIVERDGVNYFEPEHIPYFYIDENMNLYEKRKDAMTGSIIEEWKFCGTLEKVEGAREETWTLSCADEFGNMSQKTFTFYENGRVEYFYGIEGGSCICRMRAVPDMTKQLNVISVESLHEEIEVSHFGTEICSNENRRNPYGNIRLELWIQNNTAYRLRSGGNIQLEMMSEIGWVRADFEDTAWAEVRDGGAMTRSFSINDEVYGEGLYRMTIFADLRNGNNAPVQYVPMAEIVFEIVNPGETMLGAEEAMQRITIDSLGDGVRFLRAEKLVCFDGQYSYVRHASGVPIYAADADLNLYQVNSENATVEYLSTLRKSEMTKETYDSSFRIPLVRDDSFSVEYLWEEHTAIYRSTDMNGLYLFELKNKELYMITIQISELDGSEIFRWVYRMEMVDMEELID